MTLQLAQAWLRLAGADLVKQWDEDIDRGIYAPTPEEVKLRYALRQALGAVEVAEREEIALVANR